ncbi:MAG: hypothetical protein K6L73_00385 [Cellvibrionaceae bacterium]
MFETQRLAYLKELGVASYWARYPLVGAAVSPEIVPDQLVPLIEEEASSQVPALVTPQSLVEEVLPSAPVDSGVVQDVAEGASPNVVTSVSSGEQVKPFSLRYWVAGKLLFLEGYEEHFLQGSEALVFNLAKALGCSIEQAAEFFQWPMGAVQSRRQMDFDHASGAAIASLSAKLSRYKCGHVVLLGEVSARMILTRTDVSELLGQSPSGHNFPAALWCTHSVNDLLSNPALKRETWQHLLSLRSGDPS